jgi:HPt (histidine-containing phosphotransfer) domain-containing protein
MILDVQELLEEIDNDRELLAQMFQAFEADADRRMALIRGAIHTGDSAALMTEAHALKGSVGNFFAMPVCETAYQLEIMGRDKTTAGAVEAFQRLESQVAALKQAIRDLIAG